LGLPTMIAQGPGGVSKTRSNREEERCRNLDRYSTQTVVGLPATD